MLSVIRRFTNTEEKRRLISNFFHLSLLQAANYILPFITFPYLVRVLGVEYFGLLAFATATITYFSIIVDYGFDLTATREISIHRDNKEKISEIFSSVMIIKGILLIVSFLLLSLLVFSFEKFRKDALVYFLTFGNVIGQFLFPVWFFQGMERMKYITYINIVSRIISTIAIFTFVREKEDYYLVPLFNGLGVIVGGIYSLYFIKSNFQLKFVMQDLNTLKKIFFGSWSLFISSFSINLYKKNSILVLGFYASDSLVGYFAIAKNLIDAINNIASIISKTLFPYVVKNYQLDKKFKSFLFKVGMGIFLYTFIIFIVIFFFSKLISKLLTGEVIQELVTCLLIMAIVPMIIAINIPAVHTLLVAKRDKKFSKVVVIGGVLDLILLLFLVPKYSYIGASVTVLVTETFITCMLYYYSIRLLKVRQ